MAFPGQNVISVAVTGAAGQISYSLLPMIARGLMFGPQQKVQLRLLEIAPAMTALGGVKMELEDCAFPLLDSVVITSETEEAFQGAHVVVMCGAFPRKDGMERKDLLLKNASIFQAQGSIIKKVADPNVRVLVVGNPANTNALIALTTGGLNPRNVTALTRLDHNRAVAQVAQKLNAKTEDVKNVIIWGNHSGTQVPDVGSATNAGKAVDPNPEVFNAEFRKEIQQRGATVIKARGFSSAASAAKAIVDHVHDWIVGTPEGVFVSMAVHSTGNPYGFADNLIFSFPCTCKDGEWKIVEGLKIADYVQPLIQKTTEELQDEASQVGVGKKE